MNGESDPFDRDDYDPMDHLQALFADESSTEVIDQMEAMLDNHLNDYNARIQDLASKRTTSQQESISSIKHAQEDLRDLFEKMATLQTKAGDVESKITVMTADIKRLDVTKKNLTLSMTMLKRLQMLTTAFDRLKAIVGPPSSAQRQSSRSQGHGDYREIAGLTQAVIQLMAYFKSYRSIEQIATLGKQITQIQTRLYEEICEEFESNLRLGSRSSISPTATNQLSQACLVIDALGEDARARLCSWYCTSQLKEYKSIFASEEAASLDNVARRYAWMKRLLKMYEDEHSSIFPSGWRISETLCKSFSEITRTEFISILEKTGRNLNVNVMLEAFQETLDFEQFLERKVSSDSRLSIDTVTSKDERPLVFGKAISEAFEPYLSYWIQAQGATLSQMIERHRREPVKILDDDGSFRTVTPSSAELFSFYRFTLTQCSKLSTGPALLELTNLFSQWLESYADTVLLHHLPEKIQNLEQLQCACIMVNTADYCHKTTLQLQQRLQSKIDENLKSKIDLQREADKFTRVINLSIIALVKKMESDVDYAWKEMINTNWSSLETVGDQSHYIYEMTRRFSETAKEILAAITADVYHRTFCDKVVESMTVTFIQNVIRCKPISEVGAEQLLLDAVSLKKSLLLLPLLAQDERNGDKEGATVSSLYMRFVNRGMSRIETFLKTLLPPAYPPQGLIQNYLFLIADRSVPNFTKVLDLKGIAKKEQGFIIEQFANELNRHENLVEASAILSPLQVTSSTSLGIPSHVNQAARLDPAAIGNAIFSAAKDGIPNEPSSRFNENFRNFGKFFKREPKSK